MIDGQYQVFVGCWPNGQWITFQGFDRLRDGESILMRVTKHVPKLAPTWMGSLTSELYEPSEAWVIEP